MIKNKKIIFVLVAWIFLFEIVSASFSVGSPSNQLEKSYAAGSTLRGSVNLKLNNEPATSELSSSFGGTIKLFELIKTNSNKDFQYTCNPANCRVDYSLLAGSSTKTINLNNGQSALYGFKLVGNVTHIVLVNLNISSNAQPDCYNQISVDLFNDGINEIENKKTISVECAQTKNKGCFDLSKQMTEGEITGIPYCQKIQFQKTSGIRLGAWVKKISGERRLKMMIYNLTNGNNLNYCDITQTPLTTGDYVYCDINQTIPKQANYYVCVYSPEGSGVYRIRGYLDSNGCGFNSITVPSSEIASYDIFGESRQYDSVGNLDIPVNEQLRFWFENYVKKEYGNMDCTDTCIIPIKINSNKAQTINLKDILIKYDTVGFAGKEDANIYELGESQTTFTTSDFQNLYLDEANFSVPNIFGNSTLSLTLGGSSLIRESIIIKQTASIASINPIFTYGGLETEFSANVNNPTDKTIVNYLWNFGNGTILTSPTNKIKYTFDKVGVFNLTLTITDSEAIKESKTFDIESKNPKDILNQTIKEKADKIINLKQKISQMPSFDQASLTNVLDSSQFDASLIELQRAYSRANINNNNADYINAMKLASQLKIPDSIETTKDFKNVPIYMQKENIDLTLISETVGGAHEESLAEKYKNAILKWGEDNLDINVNFREVSSVTEGKKEVLFKVFEINFNQKDDSNPMVILKKISDTTFKNKEILREKGNYFYFPLKNAEGKVIFSTTSAEASTDNLDVIVSNDLSSFNIQQKEPVEKINKWWIFAGLMFLILVFGVVMFLLLKRWYKYNYEDHLFPNKNDLHNLILFIDAEKKKGSSENQIQEKLRKSGWTAEQTKYILKKYSGKSNSLFSTSVDKPSASIVSKNMQKLNKPRKF